MVHRAARLTGSSLLVVVLMTLASPCISAVIRDRGGGGGGNGLLYAKPLTRQERMDHREAEISAYKKLRQQGVDEVGHTRQAAALRNYRLRKQKRKGLFHKSEVSISQVLFPGISPKLYRPDQEVFIMTDLVQSERTHVPFQYHDLPMCNNMPAMWNLTQRANNMNMNLGAHLQGVGAATIVNKPTPVPSFSLNVQQDQECAVICNQLVDRSKLRWMRHLVERQYRVHVTLDSLPVLMRSSELNYAVRGFPVGFKAPPSHTGLKHDEYYLYNHLKFTITYSKETEGDGIYITGFDVHPVTIDHKACPADGSSPVNDPTTYLALRTGYTGEDLNVTYSYEVEWKPSELVWADRWDIYLLLGAPVFDTHFSDVVNSLMIVLFLTGAIVTIMIGTLRKDISACNEVDIMLEVEEDGSSDEQTENTGWKLVHSDVFCPPTRLPMALSVLVGNGAQIGVAIFSSMLAAVFGPFNPMTKGHTLTALVVLYVLSGCVAGYVSARIYKFCDAENDKNWKTNSFFTATALPGVLLTSFTILNIFLSLVGAATAVSFLTLVWLCTLWLCVSAPLVFLGAFFGQRADTLEVPTKTKTNQVARPVPEALWYNTPPVSYLVGGILPFVSVYYELSFIMSALWLHRIYYAMGFPLAVLLVLAATCAQVSFVMMYLQLCGQDHRWWWKSFWNCASAGLYLFLYSLWFLATRLDLVGLLPHIVYLTYMSMISLLFGIFCGSVGFLSAFTFNRKLYGFLKAVK